MLWHIVDFAELPGEGDFHGHEVEVVIVAVVVLTITEATIMGIMVTITTEGAKDLGHEHIRGHDRDPIRDRVAEDRAAVAEAGPEVAVGPVVLVAADLVLLGLGLDLGLVLGRDHDLQDVQDRHQNDPDRNHVDLDPNRKSLFKCQSHRLKIWPPQ